MNSLKRYLAASPALARLLPFFLFLAPLFVQDWWVGTRFEATRYWIYLGRTLLGAWCIWEMRFVVPEMKWNLSWEGAATGVLVLIIWVGLDSYYPANHLLFKPTPPWNPFNYFGAGSPWAWFFFSVRMIGSTLVVPPLEEVFYRSFIYRFLISYNFLEVPLKAVRWGPFFVTSILFGFEHYQWLSGILCGLVFQFLVVKKGRLGDAMFAHATTNFLLALWIYWKGAWSFW